MHKLINLHLFIKKFINNNRNNNNRKYLPMAL